MSGGSFDYLFSADITGYREGDIARMADTLAERGHHAAAERTRQVLHHLRMAKAIQEELSTVWHAVEWWQSGDYGADSADEAVQKWTEKMDE